MSSCLKALRMVRVLSVIMLGSMTLAGCYTVLANIRYGNLDTQTAMSESVFLELRSDLPQTVYISETSTAGRELTIRPTLDRQLTQSGYTLVDAPDEATYLIQINHLRLAESELHGDEILDDAITGALIAGGAAALVTDVLGASDVAVVGVGLGVGAVGFILDAKTKHIAYTLTTDVLVTESVPVNGAESELRYHKTQIVSGASKVNLKLEESLPAIINVWSVDWGRFFSGT